MLTRGGYRGPVTESRGFRRPAESGSTRRLWEGRTTPVVRWFSSRQKRSKLNQPLPGEELRTRLRGLLFERQAVLFPVIVQQIEVAALHREPNAAMHRDIEWLVSPGDCPLGQVNQVSSVNRVIGCHTTPSASGLDVQELTRSPLQILLGRPAGSWKYCQKGKEQQQVQHRCSHATSIINQRAERRKAFGLKSDGRHRRRVPHRSTGQPDAAQRPRSRWPTDRKRPGRGHGRRRWACAEPLLIN